VSVILKALKLCLLVGYKSSVYKAIGKMDADQNCVVTKRKTFKLALKSLTFWKSDKLFG